MVAGTRRAGDPAHVIIIGGGFAGAGCAQRLADARGIRVTLLDSTGVQEFTPLLYQVATAELAAGDVRFDLRRRFRHHRSVEVRVAAVAALDPLAHQVTLAGGERLHGDVLVLAAGSRADFFGTRGADRFGYPLYSLAGAARIRDRLLALLRRPPAGRPPRFVVVGGGPTGVETAGALADLLEDVAPHLPELGGGQAAEVVLVDHGRELLASFSPDSRQRAADRLAERGVSVRFGATVRQVTPERVVLADGSDIETGLAIWAGGESAAPVVAAAGLPTGAGGRVPVTPHLTVSGYPGVFAVGDAASIPDGRGGWLPQLGGVALQSGAWAARNIRAWQAEAPFRPFRYHDRGIMAMLDRQAAVAELGSARHEIHGRPAFAAWLALHAELLHDVRAELRVLARWADEFYLRPHHRAASLLDPTTVESPRLRSDRASQGV